jgi:excinuclease ABC subunit A
MSSTTKKTSPKALEKLMQHTHGNDQQIVFRGAKTHNLKNIDIILPKNKVITVTGVSGSGKSSFAFDTLYKEGQYRYIESLSSYLRQFFNLGTRPEIDYSSGLSPAIAIEQNKRVGNVRSTVGTLTEIDDYLRLLFAKLGTLYCYSCGTAIKAQTIDQIMDQIRHQYHEEKVYLLQEAGTYTDASGFQKFFEKNRKKVEAGKGFTRYLIMKGDENGVANKNTKKKPKADESNIIEYFYLETPQIPKEYFPVKTYGIFDRVTVEEAKMGRLKEDIIKILSEVKKFGVARTDGQKA